MCYVNNCLSQVIIILSLNWRNIKAVMDGNGSPPVLNSRFWQM